MASSGQRFRRAQRMRRAREFRLAAREGKRLASRSFVILFHHASATDPAQRLGLTVSRKVGNAVVRNRVKRGVREWFRTHREELPEACSVLVIARPPAASLSSREIATELNALAVSGGGAVSS